MEATWLLVMVKRAPRLHQIFNEGVGPALLRNKGSSLLASFNSSLPHVAHYSSSSSHREKLQVSNIKRGGSQNTKMIAKGPLTVSN